MSHSRLLTLLAFLAFVSLGLPDTLLGVSWTAIRAPGSFNRPISDVGFLLAFGTAGYLTSSFLGGAILTRLGVGGLLVASSACVTFALALYALTPIWPGLFVAAFVAGIGAGAIDAGLNAYGSRAFSPRVMNWMHGFWGVGATIGPLAMTAVIDRGLGWRTGYGGLAVAMVALTVVFLATMPLWRRAPGAEATAASADTPSTVLEAMRQPAVQGQALFYFVYTGVEFGAGTWLLTLLHEGRGADFAVAGTIVGCYWAALAAGRMAFGQAAAHVPPTTILRAALAGAVVAALLLFPVWPLAVTCLGAILLGFAIAPLFPTVITLTPRRVGERYASHSVAFQVSAAAVGIMVNPWLIGLAARYQGIGVLPYALLLGVVVLALINEAMERPSRVDGGVHPPRFRAKQDAPMAERSRIQQLPPNLVNRIAAGEVIERPASVVKECVENALDAGATRVTVEIEDGGKALIRVVDDGGGIPRDELPLAFASHATSKLTGDDDLFAIRTMGFRGEALASIGSVSFARIQSRTPDSDSGFEIANRGGEISDVRACATNVGTTVEIRDLFFNVPARRKFLKGGGTEVGHVADAITKIALARPDVSFRLVNGNRTTLDLPATTPTLRWLEAWPADYAQAKLDLDVEQDGLRLRGIVGLPELAQPHLKNQYLYVNGRAVRDKFIGHALKEAFRGLCEPGRNPAAVLMIELPADLVDVNVHPTKSEVRFRDSSRVHGLVLSSVRALLLGNDLVPRAKPQAVFGSAGAEPERASMREQLASYFRSDLHAPVTSNTGPAGGFHLPDLGPPPPSSSVDEEAAPPAPFVARPATPSSAIQLHNSYLVAESDDGLVIIDQHALHERIMFEDLLAKVQRGTLESQRLLLPITFAATPQQVDQLERLAPIFAQLGVEAGAIGPNGVAVHAFPSFLDKLDPAAFVRDVLERAELDESATMDHEALLRDTLDMMSCKAAVKAGDPLTPDEIGALLARRDLVGRSSNCPHGRPTTLKLSLRDLEKQFKRTGF